MIDRKTRATAMDVALKAGVSQPTVSRALRGDPKVKEVTRQKVAAAAAALNYVVDKKASGLRLETSNTLALVVICRPGEDRSVINPFYFSLLGSIASAAALKNYNLLVSFQDGEENFCVDYVDSRLADGLIVIGTTNNAQVWDRLRSVRQRGERIICWGSPGDEFDWVRSDNEKGGYLATRHMVNNGCRNIIFVGPLGSPQPQFDERYEGYRRAILESGLEEYVAQPGAELDRQDQGYDMVQQVIARGQKCDGIFAACDMIALGALQALRDNGISTISVVGFDAIRAGSFSEPGLTTIEPDFEQAAMMLVDIALSGQLDGPKIQKRTPVRLIERGSSKRVCIG